MEAAGRSPKVLFCDVLAGTLTSTANSERDTLSIVTSPACRSWHMSLSNVRLNPPLACTRSAVLALKHFPFARRSRQRAKPRPMQRCCRPDLTLPANYPVRSVRLLAPVNHLGKIIAVGLNYRDHAIETTLEITTSPLIFAKFPSSINGPDSDVVIPADDAQVDYEAELAAVIGRRAKAVPEAAALDYVAGSMPLNDVSARRGHFADKQWVRGKSCDAFCPTGPWLTTADAVADPHALAIRMRFNGKTVQNSSNSRRRHGSRHRRTRHPEDAASLSPGVARKLDLPPPS
jgi:2-keto-4-pentenoate hydratase/2-oxohepta-3-ene-1,7-dioic acid hydratase in catechol pathway